MRGARGLPTAVGEVGLTTARPPWSTVPMGALAGRPFEPAKRSAVHGRHQELGGNVLWAGDWRRQYDYGDPEGETMAVHGTTLKHLTDKAGSIQLLVVGHEPARGIRDLIGPPGYASLHETGVLY